MSESNAEEVVDWFGKWLVNGKTRELIEESEAWIARQKELNDMPVPPTEIEILQQENLLLKAQAQANADRADFQEELIVEMAMIVYP
jgi:hypothetical protein